MSERGTILLADDSENDLLLMRRAFAKADFNRPLQEVRDGEQVIAYLRGAEPYADRMRFPLPAFMLLDLNMPLKSGFDVLRWLRAQERLRRLPVIVLSASIRIGDVNSAFDLGANAVLVKPSGFAELVTMVRCLHEWMQLNQLPQFSAEDR
jgi:CheY-like chemotaxis protein